MKKSRAVRRPDKTREPENPTKKQPEMNEYYFEINNPDYLLFGGISINACGDKSAMGKAQLLSYLLLEGTEVVVTQGHGDAKRVIGTITNKKLEKQTA